MVAVVAVVAVVVVVVVVVVSAAVSEWTSCDCASS